MNALLIVLLTVIITVILVLLIETLFFYLLMRPCGVRVHLIGQQCPHCRSQPTASCSSQVKVTTVSRTGQINDINSNGISQQDEPPVDVVCETLSPAAHQFNSSAAAADDADGDGDGGNHFSYVNPHHLLKSFISRVKMEIIINSCFLWHS